MRTRKDPDWLNRPLPAWWNMVLVGGTFAAVLVSELRRPLRRSVEAKARRNARNLVVAALSAGALPRDPGLPFAKAGHSAQASGNALR
jgi:hypothetical protein